jgi:hypothetical protein
MSRTYRALTTLALSLALVGTTAAVALATPPTGSSEEVNAQRKALELAQTQTARKALYQSELAQTKAQQTQAVVGIEAAQAERAQAAIEQARAGERNLAPVDTIAAPQPVPAAPARDVGVVAIALLGLVGGLIGGAAVVAGTAASRRRHRAVAA